MDYVGEINAHSNQDIKQGQPYFYNQYDLILFSYI